MTQPASTSGPLNTEPVLIFLAGLAGIIDLGLIAANSLEWLPLTNEQTATVVAFVTGVTALAAAVLRSRVWAPVSVDLIARGPVI